MSPAFAPVAGLSHLQVILIPKLRMYFAEFLNEGFLAHLRILSLPTCVGFSTGTLYLVRSFSWQRGSCDFNFSVELSPCQFSTLMQGFASASVYRLRRTFPTVRSHSFLRHSVLKRFSVVSEFSPIVHRILFSSLLRSRLTPDRRALSGKP